jgi:glycosyltransferase involved in cell wall biosynthesis
MKFNLTHNQKVKIISRGDNYEVILKQHYSTPGILIVIKLEQNNKYTLLGQIGNETSGEIKLFVSDKNKKKIFYFGTDVINEGRLDVNFICKQTGYYQFGLLAHNFKMNEKYTVNNLTLSIAKVQSYKIKFAVGGNGVNAYTVTKSNKKLGMSKLKSSLKTNIQNAIFRPYENVFPVSNISKKFIKSKRNNKQIPKNSQPSKLGRVFIVMPTYNRPRKCLEVINQILEQKYQHLFLLVIDDGSSKENRKILHTGISKLGSHKVKFIFNGNNMNIPKTLNIGLNVFLKTNCEFFTWISDDNYYNDNFVEILRRGDAEFSYSKFEYFNDMKKIRRFISYEYTGVKDLVNRFRGLGSFMWKRSAIEKVGFYNENLIGMEDYDYLIRTFNLLEKKNINYEYESSMKYILHDDSLYIKENVRIKTLTKQTLNLYKIILNGNLLKIKKVFIYYSDLNYPTIMNRWYQNMTKMDNSFLKFFMVTKIGQTHYMENDKLILTNLRNVSVIVNLMKHSKISILFDNKLHYDKLKGFRQFSNVKLIYDATKPEKITNQVDFVTYSATDIKNELNIVSDNRIMIPFYLNKNVKNATVETNTKLTCLKKRHDIKKPVIGFYGQIKKNFDLNIINELADNNDHHVMIVDNQSNNDFDIVHKNIIYVSDYNSQNFNDYISLFDELFIPYSKNNINYSDKLLLEYFNMKKNKTSYVQPIHFDYNFNSFVDRLDWFIFVT